MHVDWFRELWSVFTCYSRNQSEVTWYSPYKLFVECFSSLMIYFSKILSGLLFFFIFFSIPFSWNVFSKTQKMFFSNVYNEAIIECCRFPKSCLMTRLVAASWALADHGYRATPTHAARRQHASLPAGATPSTCLPPVWHVCVGPPAKRRRRDTMTSQFAESDVANGDS